MNIVFACIAPHPPLLLPSVGSSSDKERTKETVDSLFLLRKKLEKSSANTIIISSPHPDWGFEVPLFFLASDFSGNIERVLIGTEPPSYYFDAGKRILVEGDVALIASGDTSHVLKESGPYGFHPEGERFDEELMRRMEEKDVNSLLCLEEDYPHAAECGLRSFAFLFGILEASGVEYTPEILSYQKPFGVGYLVADFNLS